MTNNDLGASADADRDAIPSGPSPSVSGVAGIPSAGDFDRFMDALQTVITLEVGATLTEAMVADIQFVEDWYRRDEEKATDIFHRGYQAGLERGAGADTAKLIEERDAARTRVSVIAATSAYCERTTFIRGAQACREMMARFVEQGGDADTAASIRANWRPTWGADPGAPTEENYAAAAPCDIGKRMRELREDASGIEAAGGTQ